MNPFSEYDRILAGDDALEKRMKRLSNNLLVENLYAV
jgi:CRISPR/Cas system-associated protein endoribonuclease Cas2